MKLAVDGARIHHATLTLFDSLIRFSKDNKLDYHYDATGLKLRQNVIESKIITNWTDFISNFVLVNNAPAWINFDEGRVILDDTDVYFTETHLKDHLDNTRVVIGRQNNALVVKQVNSYYAFGLNIKGLSTYNLKVDAKHPANEYLYNGKMFQDELGLDWLDYGARMYDPVIGRWNVIDPMAEDHPDYTPFSYCFNNPINLIDPFGMDTITAQQGDKQPVIKDDVVKMPDGTEATMSCDVVVVNGEKTDKKGADKKDIPEVTVKEDDEDSKSNAGKIVAGTFVLAGGLAADDVTVFLVVDNPLIPVVIVGGLLVAGSVWLYDQFAHSNNARKSTWDKHSKTRSGETTGQSRNANRGSKNQKHQDKPNPNKKPK